MQRRATKFILNNTTLKYKDRLLALNLLPLMMVYELVFFIKEIKNTTARFDIRTYLTFSTSNTRSSSLMKLTHTRTKSKHQVDYHVYGTLFPLLTYTLPLYPSSANYVNFSGTISKLILIQMTPAQAYHFLFPCSKCISTVNKVVMLVSKVILHACNAGYK